MRDPQEVIDQRRDMLVVIERLKAVPEFVTFLDFLSDELMDQRERNDVLQGVELAWGQGEAQRLNRILTMVDDNLSNLGKVKAREIRSKRRNR